MRIIIYLLKYAAVPIVKFLKGRIYIVKCDQCGNIGPQKKEVSTLYIIGYVIMGIIFYNIMKIFNIPSIGLISVGLVFLAVLINAKITKPKCSACRSYDIKIATQEEIENNNAKQNQ